MPVITVFTPTYNRSHCLERCYEGLKEQTNKDFIWLIIDDGSTDDTKKIVEKWINEGIINIEYFYQKNQGMHGAHNTAYGLIETELNVCIDSDDFMPVDAIEKIVDFWKENGGENFGGIIGLDYDLNQMVIGTELPASIRSSTLFDLYYKYKVRGDKKLVYRSELTKKYPYPLFKGEKYVGLAYKYYKLDQDYEMLLMNENLCFVEYLEDGSSKNMLHQYRKNPKGFSFYRKELMKLSQGNFIFKYRQAIHYVSSSIMTRNRNFLMESPNKLLTFLALPLGITLYTYISTKTKEAQY